jgi:signal transduction histidine kinase
MRERTALHGGELAVAPGPDGGVEVVATLPLEEHPPGDEAMAGADRGGSRQAERVETE